MDRFADKYPSMTPYQYAGNNPIIFVDVNGDSIVITEAMAENEALQNYANTEEGYNYLAQFAYEGQTVTINGQTFSFEEAGQHSTQNLVFAGVKDDAETVPVNSVEGKGIVSSEGVQSYEVYLSNSSNVDIQMDDAFHEVQHASMFASGEFQGEVNQNIIDRHHGAMMQGNLWISHERFIQQANRNFNTKLDPQFIYINTLWNQIQSQQVLNQVSQRKKIRY